MMTIVFCKDINYEHCLIGEAYAVSSFPHNSTAIRHIL